MRRLDLPFEGCNISDDDVCEGCGEKEVELRLIHGKPFHFRIRDHFAVCRNCYNDNSKFLGFTGCGCGG